ncbi:MAG: ABC transporter permease [Cyanobacteria bacterium SZAS LIN-2]|nr:ABC transporter permease [Cyanobacteria bacterium SZAS LIN-3]MBS1995840.1 ABC transporter permease [Cyanobacteria bacterium SZAS LIN-2]MBS2008332.1 ABC transporter permease [Cyanobacteria bacterium SZAS TMP-1]
MKLGRIYAQAIKEIAQFRRDKLTVALAFGLPVLALLLYGYATRLESKDIPVAVQNYDSGALSREYVDTIFANGQLTPARWGNRADSIGPLDLGLAKATIIVPPEFSRHLKQGLPAPVAVVIDATDVNNARVIKNSVLATTKYFCRTHDLGTSPNLISAQLRLWFNPGRKEAQYVAPGAVAVILWIFPCLLAALAMARENEQGTMLQLYASSLSSFELVMGKASAYVAIALAMSVLLIVLAIVLFGISIVGDFPIFLLSLVLYENCAIAFGLMVGAKSSTQSVAVQAVATAGFTTALLLSGFIYPLRNITFPLSLISTILPARYFVESCRDVFVRGSDAASQLFIPVALGLFAFVVLLRAAGLLKKMQLPG